jgi:hypothetical protein
MSALVKECSKWAEARGYLEVNRPNLMIMNRLHRSDDLFHQLSGIVAGEVFQGPGEIVDLDEEEREEKEAEKEAAKQEEEEGDGGGEQKMEEGGDDKDSSDDPPSETPESRSWDETLPKVLAASEAQGFGMATSQRTWTQTLQTIYDLETEANQKVSTPRPEEEDGDDQKLSFVEPRMVRVFYSPSGGTSPWLIALPVILKAPDSSATVEAVKLAMYSGDVMVDSSNDGLQWYVLSPDDVFVYVTDTPDVATQYPLSKIQRQLPERAREQINNQTMSETNLINGHPAIAVEHKDGGSRKKHSGEGSAEKEGQTNNDARVGPNPAGTKGGDDSDDDNPDGDAGPEIFQGPSPFNKYLDVKRRKRGADQRNWAEMGLFYNPRDHPDELSKRAIKRRVVRLSEGQVFSQTQLPLPPAYYNEQRAHRRFAAGQEWGIPIGVLLNFSIFASTAEGKAGLSALGNKASGLGGATSSTKSTAFTLWEKAKDKIIDSLEQWSIKVLARMWESGAPERFEACIAQAEEQFFSVYGNEESFQRDQSHRDPDSAAHHQKDRDQNKDAMRANVAREQFSKEPKRLMFRLKRVQPVDVIKSLHVENYITSECAIRTIREQLHLKRSDMERPENVDKARKSRNEPPPKPGAEGKDGGGDKKKSKPK